IMVRPNLPPFFDLEFLRTTTTCWWRGVDVYVSNPCDPLNRPMDYSPLWLRMDFLAFDRTWTVPLGLGLAVLFYLSLGFLIPSRRWRDQALIWLASVSSVSVYGVERGNNDIIMYLLALAAGIVTTGGAVSRLTGYGLLTIGGLLKFYPVVGLIVVM